MASQLIVLETNVRRNLSDPLNAAPAYTSAEIRQYIGDAYKKYYRIMVNKGDGYFLKEGKISLVAGQSLYSLDVFNPVLMSIRSVERITAQGTIPLYERERMFRANYNFGTVSGPAYLPNYRMQGRFLKFEPTPQAAETDAMLLEYYYEPAFPDASSPNSFTFDTNFPQNFEPMIELNATIRALEAKDGIGGVSDISSFRLSLKEQEDSFEKVLHRMDYPDEVQRSGDNYITPYFLYY